eukprot:scaffold106854_cov72-Phaeocystis_antarctica.AAC.5
MACRAAWRLSPLVETTLLSLRLNDFNVIGGLRAARGSPPEDLVAKNASVDHARHARRGQRRRAVRNAVVVLLLPGT